MWKPSLPSFDKPRHDHRGFTLLEVLIVMALMLIINGMALSMILSTRSLYDGDRARAALNQNLRSSIDLIGTDVRQLGERVPSSFPALEITLVTPTPVPPAAPVTNQLIVRRHLLESVLQVCSAVATTSSTINVSQDTMSGACAGAPPPAAANAMPTRVTEFKNYRLAAPNARAKAYIWDPTAKVGEFFIWDLENEASADWSLRLYNAVSVDFSRAYPVGANIYIIDQRTYSRDTTNNTIMMRQDDETTSSSVVDNISFFNAAVTMEDGLVKQRFSINEDCDLVTAGVQPCVWSNVAKVSLGLSGQATVRHHTEASKRRTIQRFLTSDILPRNTLSN